MSENDELELQLTSSRLYKLERLPAPKKFDLHALQEMHRYIFQDLPLYGVNSPPPGVFRSYLKTGDWHKNRKLASLKDAYSMVCYSPMSITDTAELVNALEAAQPAKLKKLPSKEFSTAISKLYAQLDYIHPFLEGNSRTLRAFTRILARESGYDLDWGRFNLNPRSRDFLYIARDRAVGELAINRIRERNNAAFVALGMDTFAKNPGLPELIAAITRPLRALAFEKYPPLAAIKEFPELKGAFQALAATEKYAKEKHPGNEQAIGEAMAQARRLIQGKLDAGEVPALDRPGRARRKRAGREDKETER
ncbi:MAG: Fic family protein [Candidatus Accumulibacter sp.]|jgi:cell filamentation protein|nr:Fic family protein [Accumulibacter sp.]